MSDNTAFLQLSGLVKDFLDTDGKHIRAVDHVSLSIDKGEFVTLLGPSGCGKTTTLRMLAGFENQDEGQIFQEGRPIGHIPPHQRNMPMVFQSYALFPHLSIFENIAYGLRLRKESKETIRNDVAMASQMVNLVGMEQRYPGELSGGQQQRVALARALVLKPSVILFDEPLSNLDAKLRVQTRTEIRRVQQLMGITAIYVTHDQSEALSISDRIVVMNEGNIMQQGRPENVYNFPVSPFVADFIGSANFIETTVQSSSSEGVEFQLQDARFVVPHERCDEEVDVGDEVLLSIKPEAIEVSRDVSGCKGRVDMSSFVGPTTEYKIEFDDNYLTVIHPNMTSRVELYDMNDEIYLHFNEEYFRVYKR